jgi:ATP:cob(I)alamin adenosyltransferase
MSHIPSRKGDLGQTSIGKTRVSKLDGNVRLVGILDSVQSNLGLLLATKSKYTKMIEEVIDQLYVIMGNIHTHHPEIIDIEAFVKSIDEYLGLMKLPRLTKFIRPNSKTAVHHQVRSFIRSAELQVREIEVERGDPSNISIYLNRLSSFVFALIMEIDLTPSRMTDNMAANVAIITSALLCVYILVF